MRFFLNIHIASLYLFQFVDSLNHYYHFLPNLFKVNVAILLFFTLNFVLINAYLKDGELKLIGANNKFSNVLGC